MTSGPKIIGMWRDRGEKTSEDDELLMENNQKEDLESDSQEIDFSDDNQTIDSDSEEEDWSHYSDEEAESSGFGGIAIPFLFIAAAVSWTGFFLWANRDIFTTMPTALAGIEMVSNWSLPVIALGILYLLTIRNSTKEASRFADVSSSLRSESEQLESRLKTVNNELTIAREFLAGETRELEFLGEQSSQKLKSAAQMIKTSLDDGLSNMSKLDDVGSSAYKNLEQLREHLPVVINTAKDVTNQIGNSGRTAQAEIAAMVASLKRVGEVGTTAKQSLDSLTERSQESVESLSNTAEEIEEKFSRQLSELENGSTQIFDLLHKTSGEMVDALHKARAEMASETSESSKAIKADLESLEHTLSSVGAVADKEEERLKALVEELNQSVAEISENVDNLDNESGEKTAKLAFAMTALEQNSSKLQESLEAGHGVADGMIERMEKLLVALDSGARELDETLPAAFKRVSEQSDSSFASLSKIIETAEKAGSAADNISEKIKQADQAIGEQQNKLQNLEEDSGQSADTIAEKLAALSTSLENVREQNETLAESSGEKLISALLRVKETAKQASEHSRKALEDSIAGSTENFEKASEEALNRILDEKIASIGPKLEQAVSHAAKTTASTAGHLTDQLKQIEEMTTSLEQRILFAKEKAEQSSDENFTRRVALLTESLNSTAIDVTKLLSNDVTDTEWAAYLKGDRGIFTRRAVRLLDSGEVREILLEYENNSEFREHVNRYIHDFEAMIRGVLATRDGSAISVTLLSSDIGKLYVALAQAIERLRN